MTTSPQQQSDATTPPEQESTMESEEQEQGYEQAEAGNPKVLVFGGNGFVGSRVCQEALNMGVEVVSVNRSGQPSNISDTWVQNVNWVVGDALNVSTYQSQLAGCAAAISLIGAFGTNEHMLKINGEANMNAIKAAKEAGVPRFVFVSVHEYGLPEFVLQGYFKGKKDAERCLQEIYGEQGVVLRPGFVSGKRKVGAVDIPLDLIGNPLSKILGYFPTKEICKFPLVGAGFVPPVSVESLAKAAIMAALDPSFGQHILDVWAINEYK
eukprot:TRINITY_DN59594_c0_g1_i1.p2 TRINITY_DN59594_c0_g1~~TRINITY_DN59594_c0_g1_i1.p2  ORF type:complete len:313 (-),score=44.68 TRINITY_DN59594_c0_g1_i1:224-1024(-)